MSTIIAVYTAVIVAVLLDPVLPALEIFSASFSETT